MVMEWCKKMKTTAVLLSLLILTAMLSPFVHAIPESDMENFRASFRETYLFDEYSNATRILTIKSLHNHSDYFYVVFRSHVGDAPPYDDYYVQYWCQGDSVVTEFHTTDYDSWNSNGLISFAHEYFYHGTSAYDNTTISSDESYCWVMHANSLDVSGNTGYTAFNVEFVPVLDIPVYTLNSFCADEMRNDLRESLMEGIYSVLEINVNIIYTIWIVFQIVAVIFVVLGIPIIVFMLIRWAIWRLSGYKLGGERKTYA